MIYIVQNYPIGWIHCERILEDECVKKYLESDYPYNNSTYILGFDSFISYMDCLHSHHIFHITNHGHIVRLWNNSSWVVVEADNNFEAIEKAKTILQDGWK